VEGFGVALWDGREQRLVLARPHGQPLFWRGARRPGSPAKLRAWADAGLPVDGARATYLSLGFSAPARPGAACKLARARCVMRPAAAAAAVRSLRHRAGIRHPRGQAAATVTLPSRSRLGAASCRGDGGLALSGGLDSGLVTVLAARHMEQPVSAFTVSFSDQATMNWTPHVRW
jgi:hypothetical protein